MTPAEKISAAQAKREEARHIELEALVRPFAVHLKEELWKREGQWRVPEKQRALLREIPADDLAAAVIRSIIGLLWRRKYDKDTGQWDVHREEEVQTVGRAVGRNVLRAYVRTQFPDLSRRLTDLKLASIKPKKMRRALNLGELTKIGYYLTDALHVAVPELLDLHDSRRKRVRSKQGKSTWRGPPKALVCLSLKPDVDDRFGFSTLLAACDRRPMIEPPLPWGNKTESRGGYRHRLKGSVPLIAKVPASEADPLCPPVVYQALNILQETPWRVNRSVLAVAKAVQERVRADLKVTAQGDADRERDTIALFNETLQEADTEAPQDALYFVHALDHRGRVYAHGVHLSPQGPDFARALLTFARGRRLTASDTKAVEKLDAYGADCFSELNPEDVTRIGQDPVETWPLWWRASDPWQYLAFCLEKTALHTALAAGKEYESTLPIWQDASSNGLQHMALLLRDPNLAVRVNVTPTGNGKRRDIYQEVAKKMTELLKTKGKYPGGQRHMTAARRKALLKHCGGEIQREHAKGPTMTLAYGATWQTFHDNFAVKELGVKRRLEVKQNKKTGKKTRKGEVPWTPLAACFATAAWDALKDVAGRAIKLLSWFQKVAGVVAETDKPAVWIVPGTDFPAGQRLNRKSELKRLSFYWSGVPKIRRQVKTPVQEAPELDATKHRTSFAPNVVHSLDAAHLMLTVTRAREQNYDTPLGTVHDSFATCAADAPVLQQVFKLGFAAIYGPTRFNDEGLVGDNNPLLDLAAQFRKQCPDSTDFPESPQQGGLDVAAVFAATPLGKTDGDEK